MKPLTDTYLYHDPREILSSFVDLYKRIKDGIPYHLTELGAEPDGARYADVKYMLSEHLDEISNILNDMKALCDKTLFRYIDGKKARMDYHEGAMMEATKRQVQNFNHTYFSYVYRIMDHYNDVSDYMTEYLNLHLKQLHSKAILTAK